MCPLGEGRAAGVRVHRSARLRLGRGAARGRISKGLVEPGETPMAAAHREVHAETGIGELWVRWGPAVDETAPYGRGKAARYCLA